jgi:biotin carboxyl carrier protein
MNISRLSDIVRMLANTRIMELEIEEGLSRVRVRRSLPLKPAATPQHHAVPKPVEESIFVTSPVVGVFRAADPPVHEGNIVEDGQVVGVVEAMRLVNPVRAQAGGVVVRVLVQEGDPVEYGQNLLELSPNGASSENAQQ